MEEVVHVHYATRIGNTPAGTVRLLTRSHAETLIGLSMTDTGPSVTILPEGADITGPVESASVPTPVVDDAPAEVRPTRRRRGPAKPRSTNGAPPTGASSVVTPGGFDRGGEGVEQVDVDDDDDDDHDDDFPSAS